MGVKEPMVRSTVHELIEQGCRENWQRYEQSLEASGKTWPQWDWIVLTAGDESQANAFEVQLEWRRDAALLPPATQFLVVADPGGRRIGSGGATLQALGEVARRVADVSTACKREDARTAWLGHRLEDLFGKRRILILHSGGESRRLPHCSVFGKVFAHVPRELPDGRVSTLFDEFLIALSGLPLRMHEGVCVASGDVLLLFDHRQLDLSRQGIVGVAAGAPAEVGTRHGVYVAEKGSEHVRCFLHKVGHNELRAAGAIDSAGNVAIDSGLVWFDPSAIAAMLCLFGLNDRLKFNPNAPFSEIASAGEKLNLYGDLLMPLAAQTKREQYIEDASDGVPTALQKQARSLIWDKLRGIPFRVQSLYPAEFIHFGTTAEYLTEITEKQEERAVFGWQMPQTVPATTEAAVQRAVALGSWLTSPKIALGESSVVEDCRLGGDIETGDHCLLSRVWSDRAIRLARDLVLDQLPIAVSDTSKKSGFVSRLHGINDDPKVPFDEPQATFLNRRWAEWMCEARVAPQDLWDRSEGSEKSLWTARLFPLAPTRDESLELVAWMQRPAEASDDIRRRWLAAERLSLGESASRADVAQMARDSRQLGDLVRVQRFYAAVEQEQPSTKALRFLGNRADEIGRRTALAARRFERNSNRLFAAGGFKAISDALLRQGNAPARIEEGHRYEDRAFSVLAEAICESTPLPEKMKLTELRPSERPRCVTARAAARIDFAGGWSDTPPFCLTYGGKVLNAAIRLRGALPIRVECEVLDRPILVLENRDTGVSREFDSINSILHYSDPSDPLAVHKAALVVSGLVRAQDQRKQTGDLGPALADVLGGGLRVTTDVTVPHGSGLGTSSILAGALLAALQTLVRRPIELDALFNEVLCMEQMLTTGGGWQDQVGGMVSGIKLTTSQPGLPQRLQIEPIRLSPPVAEELRERLVLLYTGQRRLAKGILRAIMGAFMSREPEVVQILRQIREIAAEESRALQRGNLDEMGRLMTEHWELNKRMDPGTSNPFVNRLFEICEPYSAGAKLAGAGGGGFMILIARDGKAPARLADVLATAFPGTEIAPWPCEIAAKALHITRA